MRKNHVFQKIESAFALLLKIPQPKKRTMLHMLNNPKIEIFGKPHVVVVVFDQIQCCSYCLVRSSWPILKRIAIKFIFRIIAHLKFIDQGNSTCKFSWNGHRQCHWCSASKLETIKKESLKISSCKQTDRVSPA